MTTERLVLLVEDEPNIRETIAFIVEMEGYVVRTAVNGRDGLAKIRELRPRVVLLDAMMPDMDGFEVCRAVRADAGLAATTIVMLTAMGQKADRERAEAAGVDHYLTKPFDEQEVLGLLEAAFAG